MGSKLFLTNVARYVSQVLCSVFARVKLVCNHLENSRGLGCNPDAHIVGSKKKPLILAEPLTLHLRACFEVVSIVLLNPIVGC